MKMFFPTECDGRTRRSGSLTATVRLLLSVAALLVAPIGSIPAKNPTGSDGAPANAEEDGSAVAYRAARIITMNTDDVAPGFVVVRNGRVEAVRSADETLDTGVRVVDLGDVTILPGLVNPLSSISASNYRLNGGRATYSATRPSATSQTFGAQRLAADAPVFRRIGRTPFTTLAIVPSDAGGLLAGRASVIRPRLSEGDDDTSEWVLVEKSYFFLGYARGKSWNDAAVKAIRKVADDLVKYREAKKKLEEAKKKAAAEAKKKSDGKANASSGKKPDTKSAEAKKPDAKDSDAKKPAEPKRPTDPLVELFEGKAKAFVRIGAPADIDHFFRFFDELPLKFSFVLVTRGQNPRVVRRIVERDDAIEAVVLEPSYGRLWESSVLVSTARLFLEEGMPLAFVPRRDELDGFLDVFYGLADLIRGGVREREALRAVTTGPAHLLGLHGEVGVLATGSRASFLVYDGDPLSGTLRPRAVYVDGVRVFFDDPETGVLSGEAVR